MATLILFMHNPDLPLYRHIKPPLYTVITLLASILTQTIIIFGLAFAYLNNSFFFALLFVFFDVPCLLFASHDDDDDEGGSGGEKDGGKDERRAKGDGWFRVCDTDEISELELESCYGVVGEGDIDDGRGKMAVDWEKVRVWVEQNKGDEDRLEEDGFGDVEVLVQGMRDAGGEKEIIYF